MKRRRWSPTSQQISIAIDCAAARMPITRAAELIGIGSRTLWIYAKRTCLPIFDVWQQQGRPSCVGRAKGVPHRRPPGCGASLVPRAMDKPWRARVSIGGRVCHLGYYASKELAREARDNFITARFGARYLSITPREIVMSEDAS
jgi:hypothetical protein